MNKEQVKELAEANAIYEFDKIKRVYGDCVDEYVRHFYNKLAELRGGIDDNHTCNCQHNSNSRDNEPCCRCDSKQTNADRIRNMSNEELADILFDSCVEHIGTDRCASAIREFTVRDNCIKCILDWLQSEAE